MKLHHITAAALAVGLLAGCVSIKVESEGRECKAGHSEREKKEDQAKLKAEAKVSESDARQAALAKVPNGTVKESELERENGHLQWSFDIKTPDSKDITEVNVDAISGEVINVAKEAPEDEKSEGGEKDKD